MDKYATWPRYEKDEVDIEHGTWQEKMRRYADKMIIMSGFSDNERVVDELLNNELSSYIKLIS